jgi:hypothetical protein
VIPVPGNAPNFHPESKQTKKQFLLSIEGEDKILSLKLFKSERRGGPVGCEDNILF